MRRAQECDVGKYYLGKESWRIACEATRVIKSYHNVARWGPKGQWANLCSIYKGKGLGTRYPWDDSKWSYGYINKTTVDWKSYGCQEEGEKKNFIDMLGRVKHVVPSLKLTT